MRLDGIISQATSGLDSIARKLGNVSQNVANANTPDYVRETVQVQSAVAGGLGNGVRTGIAVRNVDTALQGDLLVLDARVAEGSVKQQQLAAIDAAQGQPGSGNDLASLVGSLRDAFSNLAGDPSNATQQRQVVNKAGALAQGVNGLANTVADTRQTVQDNLVDDVKQANAALAQVGQLSDQIIAARGRNESTADLEDKRDTAIRTVTELTGAVFYPQSNGDLLAVSGATVLPTRAATGPIGLASATLAPGVAGPALTVVGSAAPIAGGRIGGELALRDSILPGVQSALDGFADALAGGFAGAGLTLFTNGAGTVPTPGSAGFAQTLQVSAAVQAAPSQVRDGAAAPGAAGDTTLINAVLDTVLATGAGTVASQAAALVAANAQAATVADGRLQADQAVQASLKTKLEAGTAVSVDSELSSMVQLQNSYTANAKVLAAVQTIWTSLLDAVR